MGEEAPHGAGSQMRAPSQHPGVITWAESRCLMTEPPRYPCLYIFLKESCFNYSGIFKERKRVVTLIFEYLNTVYSFKWVSLKTIWYRTSVRYVHSCWFNCFAMWFFSLAVTFSNNKCLLMIVYIITNSFLIKVFEPVEQIKHVKHQTSFCQWSVLKLLPTSRQYANLAS